MLRVFCVLCHFVLQNVEKFFGTRQASATFVLVEEFVQSPKRDIIANPSENRIVLFDFAFFRVIVVFVLIGDNDCIFSIADERCNVHDGIFLDELIVRFVESVFGRHTFICADERQGPCNFSTPVGRNLSFGNERGILLSLRDDIECLPKHCRLRNYHFSVECCLQVPSVEIVFNELVDFAGLRCLSKKNLQCLLPFPTV